MQCGRPRRVPEERKRERRERENKSKINNSSQMFVCREV